MTPRYSIVTPVYDPPADVLREMVESMLAQSFTDWELILVDDSSPSDRVLQILHEYAAADARIIVVERAENGGIVAASNDGLAAASGEFIGLLDHDDTLAVDALKVVEIYTSDRPELDYCYSDEDLLDPDGNLVGPFYKPDWSPERLRAQNYCTHFSVFRASLLERIGGFRDGFDGSQDYDIILRATEQAREIAHIPFVLYHWRQIATSVAMGDPSVKPYAYEAGRRAVAEHCERIGLDADVTLGPHPGNYRVHRRVPETTTSVVMVTDGASGRVWGIDRTFVVDAVRSVVANTTKPIEFVVVAADGTSFDVRSAIVRAAGECGVSVVVAPAGANRHEMFNLGVAGCTGDHVVLMRDTTEVMTQGFLDELLGLAADDTIGIVGCKTYFPDRRIRNGGYVHNGNPHEILQGFGPNEPGHRGMLTVPREVAAVSGACMAMRRDVYFEVGGLSPRLSHDFGDVDLGMKVRSLGLARIWTPDVELYDFAPVVDPAAFTADREFIERRWGHQLREDPYFNPNLQPDRNDWVEKGLR